MALTAEEEARLLAIERALNNVQTALGRVATRQEYKSLVLLFQREVDDLRSLVDQLELTGSGSALGAHKVNPSAHAELDDRYYPQNEFIDTSTGAADAGKPIVLNSSGLVDSSMQCALDHGALGGLGDDDHTQYFLVDGSRALSGNLAFGDFTGSSPMLKRSGVALQVRLGDDSTYAPLYAETIVAGKSLIAHQSYYIYWSGKTKLSSPVDGDLLLTDNAETAFGLLKFGGETISYPALKRNASDLYCMYADNSDFATFRARSLIASRVVRVGSEFDLEFGNDRSKIGSPSDADILFRNRAGTSFSMLQLGGTSASEPGVKKSGADIHIRLANDSGYTGLVSKTLGLGGTPAAGTQLDMQGTDGGLALPRLTTVQRDALDTISGMVIYNTVSGFQGYTEGEWRKLDQDIASFGTPLIPTGTTLSVDLSTGRKFIIDLASASGDVTVTLSNHLNGYVYTFKVIQGATARDITWSSVKFPSGSPPTISVNNDDVDIIQILSDGTNLYGVFNQEFL